VFSHWLPSKTVYHLVFDTFVLVAAVMGAAWLERDNATALGSIGAYAIACALLIIIVSNAVDFHQIDAARGFGNVLAIALVSLFLAASVAYAISDAVPTLWASEKFLPVSALFALAGILALRIYVSQSRFTPVLASRVMVLGTGPEARAVEQSLRREHFRVVGFYPVRGEAGDVPPARLVPVDAPLMETARKLKVNEIIVAIGDYRGAALPLDELLECKLAGMRVLDLSSYFERALGQVRLDSLRASWLIFGDGFRQGLARTVIKRIFDIVAAAILLVVTLPLMIIAAVLIWIETGFPIFYRQERVGLSGRIFKVIKFRSMRRDAEEDGKPRWAASNDDRVTRTGRFLRKYRVDELPQLVNVLKGDMSLVGPRPERAFFVDQLARSTPFYAARHSVKPGLTGWAQVRYHYGSTMDDAANKLQFDLYYVKNHTLFLDLVILFETIVVVITGKGAQ
jgi:sugar transferase (PEP-CTERM system associated)